MSVRWDKLKDNQALLLLYIADELSPSERAQVDSRLEVDPVLRAQLDELRTAHETFLEAMGWLDAATPPPVSPQAAGARAARAIRQWTTDRLARPLAPAKAARIAPPWAYPLAAAAAIIFAITISVEHYEHNLGSRPPSAFMNDQMARSNNNGDSNNPNELSSPLPTTDPSTALASAEDQPPELFDEAPSSGPLDEAEGAIAAIPSADDVDNIFLGGGDSDLPRGTR